MKLFEIPNVVNVHDLHVWSLSSQTVAMSVHIQARRTYSHHYCFSSLPSSILCYMYVYMIYVY